MDEQTIKRLFDETGLSVETLRHGACCLIIDGTSYAVCIRGNALFLKENTEKRPRRKYRFSLPLLESESKN